MCRGGHFLASPRLELRSRKAAGRDEEEISVRPHVSHAPRRRGSVFRSLVARSYLVLVSAYSHLRESGSCCRTLLL